MASSPPPPTTTPLGKFHVFLSFRGDDVRDGFISHLYKALEDAKIDTFIDYRLNQGEEISKSLLKKIEESMISVVIFSERYADSKWCLDELLKIFYCREMYGQIVLPVFFNVDPSDVEKLIGPFGEGFTTLRRQSKDPKWQKYADTLKNATSISAFVSNKYRDECALKEDIIQRVLKILESNSSISSDDDKSLVGRESSIKEIQSIIESNKDHCIVGIWGMGGIGKTAIAKALYKKFEKKFEPFFLKKVRKKSKDERQNESPKSKYLGSRRVFIVLDDVTTVGQIEDLVGNFENCFGGGGRLIITTRDKCVLQSYQVHSKEIIHIHEVKGLLYKDALELFSRSAFGKNHPSSDDDLSLSERVVEYANGVPLALVKLGQYLSSYGKKTWESAIKKLQKFAYTKIQEKLKLSYDGLDDDNQRSIFLDIVFFLKGEHIDLVEFLVGEVLDENIDVRALINKCLISISENKIIINNLLQAMSREIVREKHPKHPEKRSHLCWHDEILKVLEEGKGTTEIKGLCLDLSKILSRINLSRDPFAVMTELEFFKLHYEGDHGNNDEVQDFQARNSVKLRYLCWHGYPLALLQTNFLTKNLVILDIPHSDFVEFEMPAESFDNLKHINLSHSKRLAIIKDLSHASNLKNLILEGCTSLSEISPSTELPKELVRLILRECKKLASLPNIVMLKSLEDLHLFGCSKLDQNAQQKIQDFLSKIMHREARSYQTLHICYPGAEIPKWFTCQLQKSSTDLNIPDGWSSNEISFGLCAVVENGKYQHGDEGLKVGYDFKLGSDVIFSGILTRWDYGKEPRDVDQDHVFLCFKFHVHVRVPVHPRNETITIQFYVKDVTGKPIDTCRVKSCGFHFIGIGNPLEGAVSSDVENGESQPSIRISENSLPADPVEDPSDGALNPEERNEVPQEPGISPVEISLSQSAVEREEVKVEVQNNGRTSETALRVDPAENLLQGAVYTVSERTGTGQRPRRTWQCLLPNCIFKGNAND